MECNPDGLYFWDGWSNGLVDGCGSAYVFATHNHIISILSINNDNKGRDGEVWLIGIKNAKYTKKWGLLNLFYNSRVLNNFCVKLAGILQLKTLPILTLTTTTLKPKPYTDLYIKIKLTITTSKPILTTPNVSITLNPTQTLTFKINLYHNHTKRILTTPSLTWQQQACVVVNSLGAWRHATSPPSVVGGSDLFLT